MSTLPFDNRRWERKNSQSWRKPRIAAQRSRRPLFFIVATIICFIVWHHSHSTSLSPHRQTFVQQEPDPFSSRDRRSVQDDSDWSPAQEQVIDPGFQTNLIKEERPQLAEGTVVTDEDGETQFADNVVIRQQSNRGQHGDGLPSGPEVLLIPGDGSEDVGMEPQFADVPTDRLHKGPVAVQANLDPETEKAALISSPDQPVKEKIIEAEPIDHLSLEEKADSLPEIVHIPFEDAVKDEVLHGWEDDWVAHASYDVKKWGKLAEPKIDFVYLWVNGSDEAFQRTKYPYELNSVLNDEEGKWINSHGINRYRDWDELRYSLRSLERYASKFRNKIQIVVNSVQGTEAGKQIPNWLNDDPATKEVVQVLAQEEFFDIEKHACLPTFNSLTIENQLFNTPSDTDYLYALSDDMLLGKEHSAADIHSPLFGSVMGFKTNSYSATAPPTEVDAHRFGEKPFLIYTSWLLNRRFGIRKRKGQGHFGHALSRNIMREAISSFPGPELQSACKRFRGEPGFQLYSWYVTFHYLIERHREALLWSYIMLRSDVDGDGNLSWDERQTIMQDLEAGMKNEGRTTFRKRNYYHVPQLLQKAGLAPPKVNTDILWTSLDGPAAIQNADCIEFDVNECLAPGFSVSSTDARTRNPVFSTAVVFDRLARQEPKCGDCLLKLILNKTPKGLAPLLPRAGTQDAQRELVLKAVMRYRYSIINPDALFVMVTDAEQVDSTLVSRYVRARKELAGQLCLNDDVSTNDPQELADVKQAMTELYEGLFPDPSPFEK
ncbi:hypothetical protein A1O1_05036 [Capronia coronata CBS 617.96]|uniref:Uncharacterized protein n=1 Tax=Capronia coronata CBS 617.96 TaxID=1182541 RepID=W9Y6E9_9EURO|nr:uncharacterized protein A1O1_05036 [Capronia coronata CBS 617.96]EXJ88108.1 hypothetical protein A1O1_05036 [Capronia coronata CBS 617.96]